MPAGRWMARTQPLSLFGMIRETHKAHPEGTVVAYSDNAAVIEGATIRRFYPRAGRRLRLRRGDDAHPGQGRDAQPPDRDLALPRRGHRLGRRDSRRRRHRARLQAQGRPVRLFGLRPEHSRLRAAVGIALRQARAHRLGARHHDRRPDRRGGLQQRIRPAQPGRLLPHLRAGIRRRDARLSQADHDRRRRRQHRRRPLLQGSISRPARC